MRRRHRQVLTLLLPLAAGAACGVTANAVPVLDAVSPAALDRAEFPGAEALVRGLAATEDDAEWRAGDTLLYGVRFRRSDDVQRWLVQLRVVEPKSNLTHMSTWNDNSGRDVSLVSTMAKVGIDIFDANGARLTGESTAADVPREIFAAGPAALASRIGHWHGERVIADDGSERPPTDAEWRASVTAYAQAFTSVKTFLETLQDDPNLSPYFWRVVDKPIGAVLLAFGQVRVTANLGDLARSAGPLPPPLLGRVDGETFDWPIDINVNGTTVLRARVLARRPQQPLTVAAGVLAASAVHPADPERRVDIVLLASRRGDRVARAPGD